MNDKIQFRNISTWFVALALLLGAGAGYAQEPALAEGELNQLDRQQWSNLPIDEAIGLVRDGLESPDAGNRGGALLGLMHLAWENPERIRSEFDLSEAIYERMYDQDERVVEAAMMLAVRLIDDVEEVESAIVGRAVLGGEWFEQVGHITYLEYHGLQTPVARDYLFSLTDGPISEVRFVATASLLQALPSPPEALITGVMELIRSPEYFCHVNLVQHLPKFGSAAAAYLSELRTLRVVLQVELSLPPDQRSVRIVGLQSILPTMDSAIAALEQM